MPAVCFYFQVHQPYRLRNYTFFDIGQDHMYEDAEGNCELLLKTSRKCYLQMNGLLLDLIKKYKGKFKVSFSISGTALDQFEESAPEVLQSFKDLVKTGCVELLAETYTHSLSYLYSAAEFTAQVDMHKAKIKELFGVTPTAFRNTELIYNNELATVVENMGYKVILSEGADHILGWRSPNFVYEPVNCESLKLLLKNYSLSDDIALRFSNREWPEFPLTAEKFAAWTHAINASGEVINLFMNYETFGEDQWLQSGIFEFMQALPHYLLQDKNFSFKTPTEISAQIPAVARMDVPQHISWTDEERDLTAWLGNDMQLDAIEALYRLEDRVKACDNLDFLKVWQRLQSSDHFLYMSTKWFSGGGINKHTSPYASPYDAYINYMNVLSDFELTLDKDEG